MIYVQISRCPNYLDTGKKKSTLLYLRGLAKAMAMEMEAQAACSALFKEVGALR